MAAKYSDPVSVRHPSLPGEFVTVSRKAFGVMAKNGWVEAKSPAAKAAVEAATASPLADVPNPASKEDTK